MDFNALLTLEAFIMFLFLLPFYIVFFFMIVAARHARNERRLAHELRVMAADEEARYNRSRREAREREEKRIKEEALLREAARQVSHHDNTSDNDDEDGLHIFHKNNRPAPWMVASGVLPSRDLEQGHLASSAESPNHHIHNHKQKTKVSNMSTLNSNPTFNMGQCPICLEDEALFVLPCDPTHTGYCQNCHAEALRNLQEGDPLPECPFCATNIPMQTFEPIVPPELYATVSTRMLEWGIPADQRLYCSNTDCLKFISPFAPTSASVLVALSLACLVRTALTKVLVQTTKVSRPPLKLLKLMVERNVLHVEKLFFVGQDVSTFLDIQRASIIGVFSVSPTGKTAWVPARVVTQMQQDLNAEFGHLDLSSADQLLRLLQVIAIVYGEDIIRSEPEVAHSLHWAAHYLTHVIEGDDVLEQGLQHYTAWRIITIRDREIPVQTSPGEQTYANNEQLLEDFLWPLRQSRTDRFIDAEDEATEALSQYDDPDLAENRRLHENILLSLVGEDYEPTADLVL
ncbi:hypothetical protein KCU85_g7511, partial [Aureobasidium melanogenum]